MNLLIWIAVGMAVWALAVVALVRFMMSAHIDEEDEDNLARFMTGAHIDDDDENRWQ